ncbi:DUF3307 domain-containing protein [Aestuariibius sp. HNIBRBA575]|uniref:DUF3307 domain-containing protein n=1 Tax=Aestuariibius sp. HNIBRBA575 TaxID=3233343 RepID=UPI0034A5B6F7
MIETLIALFAAHVVADYVVQTGWMVQNKAKPWVLALHGGIVLATAIAITGNATAWQIYALGAAHLAIDVFKTYVLRDDINAYLLDQCAHLITLFAVALAVPDLWSDGIWMTLTHGVPNWVLHAMILIAGVIYTTRAGGFAIGKLMTPFSDNALKEGLENGGALIGLLERGLIYLMLMAGQPAGIGFLIAAKSVMRFETASKEQKAAEYVIIGTLASFGWAILISLGVIALRNALPPLEIMQPTS